MDEPQASWAVCMHHGSHRTRLHHLENGMVKVEARIDGHDKRFEKQDERMDKIAIDVAKLTGKIVGAIGLAQILVQVALKFVH